MAEQRRSLAGVDLNLIKALDALLQERSVTRAAARLSLTQPTVSAALARLRVLFDDELFVKTGRTMRPTPFAETLARRVRAVLSELEDLVASHAAFDPRHDEQTFRILATDYTALILIQPLMKALATEAPNVRISLESRDLAEHAPRLQRSEIDLAIVPDRFSRVTQLPTEPLFIDRFVAAAWRENTEVSDPLTFDRLAQLPYLTYSLGPLASMVDTLLEELGHPPRADTVVESFVIGPLLLKGTRQVTFVQQRLAEVLMDTAELRVLQPPCEIPPIVETLTWHPRSANDIGHRWLRARLRDLARDLPPVQAAAPDRRPERSTRRTATKS
jgi:LysR family nod box-dependent transcriptional activator